MRIAKGGMAFQHHTDRLHCAKAADHPGHGAKYAIGSAGVAILGVEGVADPAAIAGLAWEMPGEVADLALEATERGAGQGHARADAGVGHGEAGREIVAAVEDQIGAREERVER